MSALHESRYHGGRTGYNGAPQPQGIVLHKLENVTVETFLAQMCSKLPTWQCPATQDCHTYPYTPNPKGVHFVVTETAKVQLAELTATTLGLDYIEGPYPTGNLQPITDVNGPWIHVALVDQCTDQLTQLLCCIAVELGQTLPIIAASDLQRDRPEYTIPPSLGVAVNNCFAAGGFVNPPNIFDLQQAIEDLQLCCLTNTSDIISLTDRVTRVTTRVSVLEQQVTVLQQNVSALQDAVAVIPSLVTAVQTLTQQVADILSRCCPQQSETACFHYQLTPGDEMLLTPDQCIWLNLPSQVEDRSVTGCPTIVFPGPLWVADLAPSACNSCQNWNLSATVRFRLGQWCAGKQAEMYLVACGVKYLLDSYTIPMTGPQAVTLSGSFVLPSGCRDVHLLICTNDDKVQSSKVVEFASFKGCCV